MPYFKVYAPQASLSMIIRDFQLFHSNWNEEENLPAPYYITCLANTEQNLYFYVHDQMKVIPALKVEVPLPPVIVTGPKYKSEGADTTMLVSCALANWTASTQRKKKVLTDFITDILFE